MFKFAFVAAALIAASSGHEGTNPYFYNYHSAEDPHVSRTTVLDVDKFKGVTFQMAGGRCREMNPAGEVYTGANNHKDGYTPTDAEEFVKGTNQFVAESLCRVQGNVWTGKASRSGKCEVWTGGVLASGQRTPECQEQEGEETEPAADLTKTSWNRCNDATTHFFCIYTFENENAED